MKNVAGNRARASRYARALFDVAVAEGDPRAIECDLANVVALFDEHPALRRTLLNPAVPADRKVGVVAELVGRGHFAPPVAKLLTLVADRDQLALLPLMLEAYRRRVMEHLGIVQAALTTATPLSPDRVAGVEQALAQATGKQVTLTTMVDPGIIGGVVARVESTVYDGSVARQLERIRAKMTEGA